ncbi:MAG: type II toxin-antitoxin system HicB family antitoxin [Candidatus Methylomirabilis oxyfera]|nr:type II toxin-antitoxin system HicB family antitoxin [Candidatus Methylomirabilis oxyfera]
MKTLYTMVVRQSGGKWVTLCLENGVVGQGASREEAIRRLKDAVASFEEAVKAEDDVYSAPVSIRELHEFLTYEVDQPTAERYELWAVYG